MSSLTNRAIEAVDEAVTETVIFNAEKQTEFLQQARKHQCIIETPEVLANVIESEVDDSDNIDVIGHSKSLISLVCSFGVKLYTKGWKNLNAVERFMAEYYRQKQGLTEGVTQMLQQKNRENRTQAYNEYWMQGVDPLFEDTGLVMEYLTTLSGYSRSHLNSIRPERGGLAKDVFVKEFFQSVKKESLTPQFKKNMKFT
ncbi:hypothetical protein CU097_011001 [Rhizopus azygosporus]|uniref:Uncharacterized protein n=1 Tax=Rhizopus azygosporus TaxID=86630 RepID=A0A367JM16_RHIAZ|nr:hypothetical protein CU097_011001 [Rhizopus azygosporus]